MGISRRQGDHTRSGAHSSSRGLRSYFLSYKGRFHLHSSFLFATNVLTQDEPGSALGRGWRAFAGSNFNTPSPPGSHWVPATVFSMPYAQPVPMAMFGGVCRMKPPPGHCFSWPCPYPSATSQALHTAAPSHRQREMPALPPMGRQASSRIKLRTRCSPGVDRG